MEKGMRRRRLERTERGAVAIEFALVLPLLMMLVFGIIDFSRAYYTLNQIISSVREGARYAAVLEDPIAQQADVKKVVREFGLPMGGRRIADNEIEVVFDRAAGRVTVKVKEYPFTLITPLAKTVGVGTIAMSRSATFRWERAP
jgi:hypothetical protein